MNINRNFRVIAFIALTVVAGQCIGANPGGNPIFRDVFTADPAAMVVGDTVYVYAGHDNAKGRQFFTIPDWRCYSSKDMKTWTPQGSIMQPEEFKFARPNVAWASHMIEKGGGGIGGTNGEDVVFTNSIPYHENLGDIHCGTNVRRIIPDAKFWE